MATPGFLHGARHTVAAGGAANVIGFGGPLKGGAAMSNQSRARRRGQYLPHAA